MQMMGEMEEDEEEAWGGAKKRRPILVYKDHFKRNSTFLIVSAYNSSKS